MATRHLPMLTRFAVPGLLLLAACAVAGGGVPADMDWAVTGGDPGNRRYSPLTQINRENVEELAVAWIYRTRDATDRSQIQATPIVVDGVLYSTSPMMKVFALRADTGEELWTFDPTGGEGQPGGANRGVVYWADGDDRRILFTANRRLYAVDARSGLPIPTFGDQGSVDLAAGLGMELEAMDPGDNPFGSGMLIATSPGVVYEDLLIQGSRVSEGEGALPGHVQAFDIRTGEVRWVFHTIPQPGEFGRDTWPVQEGRSAGGANSWAGMAVDVQRGIVFAPTGSASPDFWGGGRAGANLFANSLIALDAATGERIWHFQTVHHDLWDRDLPAAPNLLTVTREGERVDAIAQITKQGFVFLFDRQTGEPLFPIEERPVPPSSLPGEQAWPTQPFPVKPEPFARQTLTEADLIDISPEARAHALERFRTLRQPVTPFTPPSLEGSVLLPAFDGGGGWGGAAVDPTRGVLYVNGSDVPGIAALAPMETPSGGSAPRAGREVYATACAGCHGEDRSGDGDRSPSLVGVESRMSAAEIREIIDRGRGFMPPFADLPEAEKRAVTAYLLGSSAAAAGAPEVDASHAVASAPSARVPYRFLGYERWSTPDGVPAIKPPWGTLTAIDMNSGEHLWRIPLGEHPGVTDPTLQPTGTRQYGGPIVTASGLLFIAATMDEKFRVIDSSTGEILWEAELPAAGYATPATYMVNGQQYVVIAAGGGKLGTRSGDAYVAFALPE